MKKKNNAKQAIDLDKQKQEFILEKRLHEQKYKILLQENTSLQKQIRMINEIPKVSTHKIKQYLSKGSNEATAIIVASDWHIGEIVKKEQVNGLNEYNPDIAKKRVEEFFQNSVRIVSILQKDIPIPTIILALIGDMINNYLHDDARETNAMPPTHEVQFAQDLICSGIEYILAHTKCNLIIPCKSGNHSRFSSKQRVANEEGVSLEYLMYCSIARYFKGNKRITFIIENNYHTIIDVYGMKIRFHHGHDIKYQGGVGGITISTNKAIAQWNKSINVSMDVFGHYHTFFDGGNFILNGSIVGYNAFALSIKASYEKPKQALFLIDKKRGKTVTCPIMFSI